MSERWGRDRVTEAQRPDDQERREPPRDANPATRDEPAQNRDAQPATRQEPATTTPRPVGRATTEDHNAEPQAGSSLDSVIILAVALVAAAASYGHMLEVATWAGEPVWIARAFPVTVDGLVLAALRRGRAGRWWLALGIAVSVAANMLARYPDLAATAGPVVSAWPPLALFGTHRLLHARRSQR